MEKRIAATKEKVSYCNLGGNIAGRLLTARKIRDVRPRQYSLLGQNWPSAYNNPYTGLPPCLPMSTPLTENVASLHREVQHKFGRNMLRLQQYEMLMKKLVAERHVAGPPEDLPNIRTRQIEDVAKKTLGLMVADVTENFITPKLHRHEQDHNPSFEPKQTWFVMTSRIEMAEEDFKLTQQNLAEVVDLRNELAHHFLEKYDIWTESGCLAAATYLDVSFKIIEDRYEELLQWAKHTLEARSKMAAFMHTPEYSDFLLQGFLPDAEGNLGNSSFIISLLLEAETSLAQDGWTPLRSAIDHIGKREPELTPKRYGYRSWRHVLHETKQFEIRKEQKGSGTPTETWYRSRP